VEAVIVLLLIALIVAVLIRPALMIVTVHDYQRGLRYRGGRLIGLLSPGTHLALRPLNEIQLLDARPTSITVPGQEILTADGVALKVSLTARYVVADPVAGRTADELLGARADLGPAVADAVASEIARIGVELLGVDVRDVMVPSELKRAFAGIVAARREGEAALERARGETAALRSLANAGRLLDDNPGLVQLRILQQLEASSGNTIVLGVGGSDGRLALPAASPPAATSGRGRARSTGRPPVEG
jgi:regulator of protease activity HflC (stomatin/prohibitin superfamily)